MIPVANSDEVVEVQVSELPEDEGEVIDILQAELAPLDVWLRFAVEYYRQGRPESFEKMLEPLMELYRTEPNERNRLFEQFGSVDSVKRSFLAILNALAAFHTVKGSRERDKTKKKAEFDKAKRYYDEGEGVDLLMGTANVGRAVLQLAKGELGRAEKTLTEVDAFNRNSVPALLGKACAKYNSGNFREALKLYRKVFEVNPCPPPAVRLGLGYCYNKLGQARLARDALKRTLELREDCVDAMVGLAVLHLNDDEVPDALALLKRAYDLEPFNPSVLNHLANHYFYKAQYDRAITLASRAHKHADAKAIKAESCFHMARSHHAQGDFTKALQFYHEATKNNPDYIAPQFGLGQMHLKNRDPKKAIACFERVLRAQPSNTDALKVLGHLYKQAGRTEESLKKLTAASELAPNDAGVWLELGQLQQGLPGALPGALKAYEKAAGILKRTTSFIPPELWNNLGAIRHKLGKLETAEQAYGYAIKVASMQSDAGEGGGEAEWDARCITTHFNLGRLYEELGDDARAIAKYKGILERHPNYPGCFSRLAACEERHGCREDAMGWAQKELTIHPKRPEAWCALGNLQLAAGDLRRAEESFNSVLKSAEEEIPRGYDKYERRDCKKDAYASGQLAWIQLQHAANVANASDPGAPLTAACSTTAGSERIDKAVVSLKSILVAEPHNVYAANGLGVACVAKGRLHEARSIFTQVREASAGCDAAAVNLAQVNAALGEHATAVSLYEGACKKAPAERKLALLLLQARSHFDARKFPECRGALYRAIRLCPSSHAAWHNLGLALIAAARHPDGPDAPARDVDVVAAACTDAKNALQLLRTLNPDMVAKPVGEGTEAGGTNETVEGAAGQATETASGSGQHEGGDDGEADEAADAPVPMSKAVLAASAKAVKDAAGMGLTAERRRDALRSCEKVLTELEDEAERAGERARREAKERAEADAKMLEYDKAREEAAERNRERARAEEEARAEVIREQKEKLAAKLEAWREADAREAEAAKSGERSKKRKKGEVEEEAAVESDDDGVTGAVEAHDAEADADAEDDLFGSDDEDDGKADSAGQQLMREGAEAGAGGGGGDRDVDGDIFGSDGDDGGAGDVTAGEDGASSNRLVKRRKIIESDDDDDDGDDRGGDGDDGSVNAQTVAEAVDTDMLETEAEAGAEAEAEADAEAGSGAGSAPRTKRRMVMADDDDE